MLAPITPNPTTSRDIPSLEVVIHRLHNPYDYYYLLQYQGLKLSSSYPWEAILFSRFSQENMQSDGFMDGQVQLQFYQKVFSLSTAKRCKI
jgi:hypothetical protein